MPITSGTIDATSIYFDDLNWCVKKYIVCKITTVTDVHSVVYSQMIQYLEYSGDTCISYQPSVIKICTCFALWCFWHGLNSLLLWLPQYQSNSPEEYGKWLTRTHHELWYDTNKSKLNETLSIFYQTLYVCLIYACIVITPILRHNMIRSMRYVLQPSIHVNACMYY